MKHARAIKEDAPLTFEDLPNDILGVIMRKLEEGKDKLNLAKASPSARRLCVGSNAHPGILGPLRLRFIHLASASPVSMRFMGTTPEFALNLAPSGAAKLMKPFLRWLQTRSRAFERIEVDPSNAGSFLPSVLAALSPSFQGPVTYELFMLRSSEAVKLQRYVSDLCAIFSSNDKALRLGFVILDVKIPPFLRALAGFKIVSFRDPRGAWDPSLFSNCDVEKFRIVSLKGVSNLRLPSQWKNLRHLELGNGHSGRYSMENVDLTPVFASLSSSSLASLKVVKLGALPEGGFVERLKALETLPALTSLELCVELKYWSSAWSLPPTHAPSPAVQDPKPLCLPTVKYLSYILVASYDPSRSLLNVPLDMFRCPELLFLGLQSTQPSRGDRSENPEFEGPVSWQVRPRALAGFPALQCLCFDRANSIRLTLDLSAADLSLTPNLAFISTTDAELKLHPAPLTFGTPVRTETVDEAFRKPLPSVRVGDSALRDRLLELYTPEKFRVGCFTALCRVE